MYRLTAPIALVLGLVSVTGCASSLKNGAQTATAATSDARWQSPEERELQIVESGSAHAVADSTPQTSIRPNGTERPHSGAVHAAY